jgi:hypothetical protein
MPLTSAVPHRRLASLALALSLLVPSLPVKPAGAMLMDAPAPVAAEPQRSAERIETARPGRTTLAINLAILGLGSLWLAVAARRFGQSSPPI